MNRLQIAWWHFKMQWFGNKSFEKEGGGIIPCEKCGKIFQSWNHFDYYDNLCEWCRFAERDPIEVKQNVEQILSDYNSGAIDWDRVKASLLADGIKVRYSPVRCAWMNCELKGTEPSLGEIMDYYGINTPTRNIAKKMLVGHRFKRSDKLCEKCFRLMNKLNGVRK